MHGTYLSEVAQEQTGWAPVATLFISAVSIMVLVRFFTWIWQASRTTPPPDSSKAAESVPYWPAQRPAPVLVPTAVTMPLVPVTQEIAHVGAEEWRAHELKPLVPLDDAAKAALMTETAEFVVVWDSEEQALVPVEPALTLIEGDPYPDAEDVVPDPYRSIDYAYPRLPVIEDELGAWDPNTVDWLEPATYVETLSWTVRTRPDLLDDAERRHLAYVIRREALILADAVITGGS